MSIMKSKFKYMYDAAPSITLRAKSSAAVIADANSDVIVLDTLQGYWTNNELADQTFAVIVNVEAVDHVTGDETYKLDLQFGPIGFASNAVIGTLAAIPGTGQYIILVDADTARAVKADGAAIRLALDVNGTTPSITYYAWISAIQK